MKSNGSPNRYSVRIYETWVRIVDVIADNEDQARGFVSLEYARSGYSKAPVFLFRPGEHDNFEIQLIEGCC